MMNKNMNEFYKNYKKSTKVNDNVTIYIILQRKSFLCFHYWKEITCDSFRSDLEERWKFLLDSYNEQLDN